jgi:hypothetical protein
MLMRTFYSLINIIKKMYKPGTRLIPVIPATQGAEIRTGGSVQGVGLELSPSTKKTKQKKKER